MDLLTVNDMSLADAAATYGEMGWPVLPLLSNRKQPATKHGLLEATNNVEQIKWWWRQDPNYNIGLVTGIVFDALDLDGVAGINAFANWLPGYYHHGPVQATGKGYHLLFEKSGSKNHARINGDPVDYRGIRGYIVGAPSIHPDGHKYLWSRSGILPAIPRELRSFLFPEPRVRKTAVNDPVITKRLEDEKNIVEIFQEMGYEPRPWGNKAYLNCPFHKGDNTPSLVLYPNTNSFYCFGCDAWGDPLNVRKWQATGELH